MIPKKDDDLNNPNNYRPISLTNSIIKLIEKLVQQRLIKFLDEKKIISANQSGFRSKRQTTDNLVYLTQKCHEAFDSHKYVCAVIFDIMKAFDKVWLPGLIFKLHKYKIPFKMGNWLIEFIENRKFMVKIENQNSNVYSIETGVPQGAILSPTLFSLFINDILQLNEYPNQNIHSLLFAEDLLQFNMDKNINRIIVQMQIYLNHLENQLIKWRMVTAANKCSFNIYSKGKTPKQLTNKEFSLKIFNEDISIEEHPKYLGIYLINM